MLFRSEVRNLPFDPDIAIFAFKVGADGRHQIAHHPNAAFRSLEGEPELIRESHWVECIATCTRKRMRRWGEHSEGVSPLTPSLVIAINSVTGS